MPNIREGPNNYTPACVCNLIPIFDGKQRNICVLYFLGQILLVRETERPSGCTLSSNDSIICYTAKPRTDIKIHQ